RRERLPGSLVARGVQRRHRRWVSALVCLPVPLLEARPRVTVPRSAAAPSAAPEEGAHESEEEEKGEREEEEPEGQKGRMVVVDGDRIVAVRADDMCDLVVVVAPPVAVVGGGGDAAHHEQRQQRHENPTSHRYLLPCRNAVRSYGDHARRQL